MKQAYRACSRARVETNNATHCGVIQGEVQPGTDADFKNQTMRSFDRSPTIGIEDAVAHRQIEQAGWNPIPVKDNA